MILNTNLINDIAEKIKRLETNREKLGNFLKEIKYDVDISGGDVVEKRISYKVENFSGSIKVCAVDGGVSQSSYHGLDIILVRAVAVIAKYSDKLEEIVYYPDAFPSPDIEIVSDPFSDEEFVLNTSLVRQRKEIEIAIEASKKYNPDMILLDGSIVPHPSIKPKDKKSKTYQNYIQLIESFKELYSLPYPLVGTSEDSRGRKFCNIVSEKILSKIDSPIVPELKKILNGTRDTNLLYHVLEPGERTCVFKYGETPVTEDLGNHQNNLYSFYLRPAEFDRPIRVDFYSREDPVKEANWIASVISSLYCHSSYGYPAPLVEADLRAKLKETDVDMVHGQLIDRIGLLPSLFKLRRETRPFS